MKMSILRFTLGESHIFSLPEAFWRQSTPKSVWDQGSAHDAPLLSWGGDTPSGTACTCITSCIIN